MSKKICHATDCRKRLAAGKSKYCSSGCQQKQYMREYRHNKKQEKPINSEYSPLTPMKGKYYKEYVDCLLYTSPSPRDGLLSRMPSSA